MGFNGEGTRGAYEESTDVIFDRQGTAPEHMVRYEGEEVRKRGRVGTGLCFGFERFFLQMYLMNKSAGAEDREKTSGAGGIASKTLRHPGMLRV